VLPRAGPCQVKGNAFHLNSVRSSKLVRQRFQLFSGTRNQNEILFACRKGARKATTQAARSAGDKGVARPRLYLKLV
jgi:hypothetical protein